MSNMSENEYGFREITMQYGGDLMLVGINIVVMIASYFVMNRVFPKKGMLYKFKRSVENFFLYW